jgi:hypothetical protein
MPLPAGSFCFLVEKHNRKVRQGTHKVRKELPLVIC